MDSKTVPEICPQTLKHHYLSLPLPEDKHITIATMDKQNALMTLVPARAINHVFRSYTCQEQLFANLKPENTDGFVKPPGTVIEVELPAEIQSRASLLRECLYANQDNPEGMPEYRPHITFPSAEAANEYRTKYNGRVPLSHVAIMHAKARFPVFRLNWKEKRGSESRVWWHPSYDATLRHVLSSFSWLPLSFSKPE